MTPENAITVQLDDTVYQGRMIDLPATVSSSAVLDAIRGDTIEGLSVDCEQPQAVHDHVGYIHSRMEIQTRTALARAGRSRGLTTTYDDEISTLETEIEELDAKLREQDQPEAAECRRTIAETGPETTELREAVEAARGRLQAYREHDLDTDEAAEELEAAIAELAEQETTTAAAVERLEQARKQRRERRDLQEKRFRLEDKHANLKRDARASLVEQLHDEFTNAVEAVPNATPAAPFDAPPVVTALAVARIADLDAPVVLDCDHFDSLEIAADWLTASVIQF